MKTSNSSPLAAASLLVELKAAGSRLRVAPADSLTDELRQAIREHRTGIVRILAAEAAPDVESYLCTTQPLSVRHSADMAPQSAPATVTCGSCVRFQPGTTKMGIGVCSATSNGLPPKEQRGYLAAYPMAPRLCRPVPW